MNNFGVRHLRGNGFVPSLKPFKQDRFCKSGNISKQWSCGLCVVATLLQLKFEEEVTSKEVLDLFTSNVSKKHLAKNGVSDSMIIDALYDAGIEEDEMEFYEISLKDFSNSSKAYKKLLSNRFGIIFQRGHVILVVKVDGPDAIIMDPDDTKYNYNIISLRDLAHESINEDDCLRFITIEK